LAVRAGAAFIDTAQAYGSGESERICGDLFKGLPRDQFIIQTKWYVVPDNATNTLSPVKAPEKQLKQSLERMALDYVDVGFTSYKATFMQARLLKFPRALARASSLV